MKTFLKILAAVLVVAAMGAVAIAGSLYWLLYSSYPHGGC